ncbi:hypothetical protein EYC80_008708 [Monilinia laxa]|uniref:Uncharacterized protein n=1 Tax=Monilinia laxa TaxID=61186 RepID=A0A5N6K152_MONLA|nr:hypothetical protein EYC80_008708 [Monilinia laxa]
MSHSAMFMTFLSTSSRDVMLPKHIHTFSQRRAKVDGCLLVWHGLAREEIRRQLLLEMPSHRKRHHTQHLGQQLQFFQLPGKLPILTLLSYDM